MLSSIFSTLFTLLLLGSMVSCEYPAYYVSSSGKSETPPIRRRDVCYMTDSDGWGHTPKGWRRQQRLLKKASDSDLDEMARYAEKPSMRAFAYQALASKRSDRCFDILLEKLTDKERFWVVYYDIWSDTDVSSFMLETTQEDSLLLTKEQTHYIDSMIVFGPGYEHLDKSASIPGLQASEILYKRIRELYLGGDSRVLPFLAEYHNSEDISFVISSLRKYKADIGEIDVDDEHYNSVVGAIAETVDNAIAAVVKWPDSAFVPVLEEMRNDGVLEGFHSYYRQMMFFEAAMAYDNDWAYNIIEDIFNKDYDDTSYLSSYPECLYRAYYEGEKRARFLPLVEKYGKESSVWDDWQ